MRIPVLLAATVASLAVACGDSNPPPQKGDGSTSSAWRSAVGAVGLFAQTFDDQTWRSRSVAPGSLFAVTCVGNAVGWTAGEHGFIAHTTDGGATWTPQDAHVTAALRAIRFGTSRSGVVAGDGGVLAVTRDGGTHWSPVSTGTSATLRSAAVSADASLMIVVGDAGTLLRSSDGGTTWVTSTLATGADLRGVTTDATAHLVLAVDALGGIWASSDRGTSFTTERAGGSALESVSLSDDGASALAVGGATALVRSGGAWSAASLPVDLALHAALVAEGRFYAGGEHGALVVSADGGKTWATRALGSDAAVYALDDL